MADDVLVENVNSFHYLRVKGKIQGTFTGGITRKDRGGNWFKLLWVWPPWTNDWYYEFSIAIVKAVDSLSFKKAYDVGEVLSLEIDIETLRPGQNTLESHQMGSARITKYNKEWNAVYWATVEEIKLSYEKLDDNIKPLQRSSGAIYSGRRLKESN